MKEGISKIIDSIERYYHKQFKKEHTSPNPQERLFRNINVKLREERKEKLKCPINRGGIKKVKEKASKWEMSWGEWHN